jgi:hypothetical protein
VATNNSVFISYRREQGYAWAKLLWDGLRTRGVDAFLDLESLRQAGAFDVKILNQIAARPYFVPVLVRGSLKRCKSRGDWLRKEIEHAVATQRTIVPLIIDGFDFAEAEKYLPAPLAAALSNSNGVNIPSPEYFDAGVDRLVHERLSLADMPTVELSLADHQFAAEAHQRAAQLPAPVLPPPPPPGADHDDDDDGRRRWPLFAGIAAGIVAIAAVITVIAVAGGGGGGASDRLDRNEHLSAGEHLQSTTGDHVLALTRDGQLVLSTNGVEEWRSDSPQRSTTAVARMQGDGNLVIYRTPDDTSVGNAMWASLTQGRGGDHLQVIDDNGKGAVVIVTADGRELWRRPQARSTGGGGGSGSTTTEPSTDTTTSSTSTVVDTTTSVP